MATALKAKNMVTGRNRVPADAAQGRALATKVYCTLCTRVVDATVTVAMSIIGRPRLAVLPGQKCPHCAASLDAAYVLSNLS